MFCRPPDHPPRCPGSRPPCPRPEKLTSKNGPPRRGVLSRKTRSSDSAVFCHSIHRSPSRGAGYFCPGFVVAERLDDKTRILENRASPECSSSHRGEPPLLFRVAATSFDPVRRPRIYPASVRGWDSGIHPLSRPAGIPVRGLTDGRPAVSLSSAGHRLRVTGLNRGMPAALGRMHPA